MVIRKFKKNNPIKRLVFISFLLGVVLWIGINFLIPAPQEKETPIEVQELTAFSNGQTVTISGVLIKENKFPLYTHVLTAAGGLQFGLKSPQINLNTYTWAIEVVWIIEETYKNIPIVRIDTVKLPKNHVIVKNNTYFFVNELLFFDFSQDPAFNVVKTTSGIDMFYNNMHLINIKSVVCNKITQNKNCENTLLDLRYNAAENFTSEVGFDYYRYKTGTWIAFNRDIFGYIFKPGNDDMLLDKSSVVTIIDFKNILRKKQDLLTSNCKNDDQHMTDMQDPVIAHNTPRTLTLNIKWKTNKGWTSSCMLTIDLWNDWKVNSVIFDVK